MTRRPLVKDQGAAVFLGVAGVCGGALLLWDAYERRGRKRPFALKLLPGA